MFRCFDFEFSMSIPEISHLKKCICVSKKHTGHLEPFQHSNRRSLSKILEKKLHKTLKDEKLWVFCQFRCQFETFFIEKLKN